MNTDEIFYQHHTTWSWATDWAYLQYNHS